ncbi:ATP-dependent helicase [Candidatus Saccharibacteria bacterium]|nr:ATP-dependent helicase [Candidatus Saccharibacteria bacterium]
MGLNSQQKKAVEYLDGPLLVLAGPGTGKTQLLSEKVAYILKTTDTNPNNILCLTFTETGARNMRERLKTIIGKDALKVNIGTYHAFGQELLSQYKSYSDTYARRLDAAIDEVMQYKIVKAIQDALPGTDILRGDPVKDIIAVIGDAKGANLTAEDLNLVAMQNIEDSEVLSGAISPLLLNIVPRKFRESYDNAYQPIYELLKSYSENSQEISLPRRSVEPPRIERTISLLARDLREAMLEAEAAASIKPLSNWKDSYFEKDDKGNYRLKDRVANKKLKSLSKIMGEYERYLTDNGLFDFNDMIEEASRLIQTDAGFKATLQEKYQFIMLDEFQDTNPSQLSIVKQITDYEKPLIMAVGDDDQAIYEFQGANATNLTDFQKHYEAEVIPLTENYRSTQEILDFAHDIIAQAPDRFADKVLTAHRENPTKSAISRIEFNSSDAEYGFVADKIAELIADGVEQSEIAVISYKSKYFEPLLPYLKAHPEIKIAYEKRDNLFENKQMRELITLARFAWEIANEKRASVQIMEVLTYEFWGISPLEIVKLTGQARRDHKPVLTTLAEEGSEKLTQVMQFITNLAAKSFTEPLEVMIDYMIGTAELGGYTSPFLHYYTEVVREVSAYQSSDDMRQNSHEYKTFMLYENLASLRGKLARHFGDKRLMLGDLIAMVDDYEAADMALNTTSPYRDAESAVQILTAHKSKGLEFEYVFILSADHTAWGKGKGNNNLLALPKNLMQIRHTGTTDSEKLRILYVALTRAKKALYITNSLQDFNGKSPERLEYFDETAIKNEQGEVEVESPYLPSKRVILMYDTGEIKKRRENLQNWMAAYLVESPDMRAIYKERAGQLKMSASALTSFIDVVYAGPQEFFKAYILQTPREPETEVLAYGDLIHKTFEKVTKEGISDEAAEQYFLEELSRKDLPSEVMKKLGDTGPAALSASLTAFKDIIHGGLAEVDFANEKIVVNSVPVTGKIDHIVVDDAHKTIEVYDYKTGPYHNKRWQSHATLYKYMLQLIFYKMLLNHSPKYAKYKVLRAHILFVTPDKDGLVHDKVYDYDEKDEAECLKLLGAVYKMVETLEFMDDPEIFVAPDGTKDLKDIKEFTTLMLAKGDDL